MQACVVYSTLRSVSGDADKVIEILKMLNWIPEVKRFLLKLFDVNFIDKYL